MANIVSGSFIGIDQNSSTTPEKSYVRQFVDILQTDIEGTNNTRKKYEVFVTGGVDQSPVRSSLFQTVYDQDFTLSTSNPLLDVTVGTFSEDITTTDVNGNVTINPRVCGVDFTYDASGKISGFANSNNELMIREKVNIYRQYAQTLLGDPDSSFVAPHGESVTNSSAKRIDAALFINIKRLFTRDNIFKGSFNIRLYKNGSYLLNDFVDEENEVHGESTVNLDVNPTINAGDSNDFVVISDSLASTNLSVSPVAGEVSTLTLGEEYVGLIYYDKGIVVLDVEKVFNGDQILRGIVDSNSTTALTAKSGPWYAKVGQQYYENIYTTESEAQAADDNGASFTLSANNDLNLDLDPDRDVYIPQEGFADAAAALKDSLTVKQPLLDLDGNFYSSEEVLEANEGFELFDGPLYPDFVLKASIDDFLDHVCVTRFGDQVESAITFRNETVINSRLIFCRAAPSQLNYSTNPSYTDDEGNIIASVDGVPFSYMTTVGLYDSAGSLVAVAKTSRPIEKNRETDLSIRIRLDF